MHAEADWADLELAQRIAQAGTLSGAARALRVDQTTAARRLAALEHRLGAALFDRIGGRLAATPALAGVLDRLRAMDEDALAALAILRRKDAEMRSEARIDSVGLVLAHMLAPALPAFRRRHPGVALSLHADDRNARFDRREADIAVRLGRAADEAALTRKIGELRFRLCRAAGGVVGEAPPIVRYSERLSHLPEMRLLEQLRPGARAAVQSDRLDVLIEAALALGGEIMLPEALARRDRRFAFVDDAAVKRDVYRLVHADRVRAASVAAAVGWVDDVVAAWTRALA